MGGLLFVSDVVGPDGPFGRSAGPEGQGGGFDSPSLGPGCGALFLLRAAQRPRKMQTAAPAPPRLFLPQAAPRLRSLWTPYPNDQGSGGDRVQWTMQGAAAGTVLQFLQGHSCPKKKLAKHKRAVASATGGVLWPAGPEGVKNPRPSRSEDFCFYRHQQTLRGRKSGSAKLCIVPGRSPDLT